MSKKKSKYVKLSHLEHILARPDSYIGSVISDEEDMYIVENNDLSNINIIKKKIKYNPGFLKIYDEIISNASDHSIRTGDVKIIKINIDNKKIVVYNDGPTVPIEIHPDEKVYIPQMLWMDLLTGENYNDDEVREVAGKNGYGSKLCNIYSKKFIIECCDGKLKYIQTAKNNMTNIEEPLITKVEKGTKSYTKITYYPDYSRFDFGDMITDDLRSLMYKRSLDLAVYIPNVRVIVDSKTIPIKKISDYMSMHLPKGSDLFHEKLDNGWEIGIAKSNQYGFESNSIVNGITTFRGGTHVNFISLMVSKLVSDKIKKNVTWTDVKNKLHIFLICKIPNPSFDTQTKVNLTTKMTSDIHNNSKISDLLVKKILKSDIVLSILEEFEMREKLQLKRMGGGKKSKVNLPKLQDANRAGGKDSDKCHLFLAEGDSALASVVSGMSVVGRDYYGAFPLKGKVLNVRDASIPKIKDNKEIQSLLDIIGLEFGKVYKNTSELRYGKIVLFTDADVDGIHIKGLLLNFFEYNWPELLKMDFIFEFITPILKAKKGKLSKSFYTLKEYETWKLKKLKGWTIKYYKGLGTSTPKESKEYFEDINKHLLPFNWDTDKNHDNIDMIFRQKRSDDRKKWMLETTPVDVEKYKTPTPISSFLNNEMITFSLEDNIRSIPDLYDGMKPSQRKIIHTALKKNITKDVAVAGLGGIVKSETKYHHGECLDYDTEINLSDGSTIKIGDWYSYYADLELIVKCVDFDGNETTGVGKNPIEGKKTDIEYEIELEDGDVVKCTDNHLFLIGKEWIPASLLKSGMSVIKNITVNKLKSPKIYYDIEVEKHHNFSITESEIIVHNSSLEQGIINLAQDYVGTNNISLLVPEGQFGTRMLGGKDASSSRYLNTYLSPITKIIFNSKDNNILNYIEEDGQIIEPENFKPIIPMILVNGTDGIGTGWSTNIPQYNPNDIIRVIENKINKKKSNKIHPYYNNFKGEIIQTDNGYITRGVYDILNSTTIRITELPIGMWTQNFTEHLHTLIEGVKKTDSKGKTTFIGSKFIKKFTNHSTDTSIDFTIDISRENMVKLTKSENLISKFKLETKLSVMNMNAFVDGKIVKFKTPEDIIDVFYMKRLGDYKLRKESLLSELDKEKNKLDNQVRFIKMVINDKLKVNNRKKDLIIKNLVKEKFDLYDDSYDYLMKMPIYSLTKEKVDELIKQAKEKLDIYKSLKKTKIEELWLTDLQEIKKYI